jgi:hypothetical protein
LGAESPCITAVLSIGQADFITAFNPSVTAFVSCPEPVAIAKGFIDIINPFSLLNLHAVDSPYFRVTNR